MTDPQLDQFVKSFHPAAVRSRVVPHLDSVRQLRALGYSLRQVSHFLATKDVTISVSGLSAFLRRQDARLAKTRLIPPPLPRSAESSEQPLANLEPSSRPFVDIDQIGSRKVDLDALARLARSNPGKRSS